MFNDAIFDDPAGWTAFYRDDRFDQRLRIVDDAIFSETIVAIRSSPPAVVALLRQPWDWWAHGTVVSSTAYADGSFEMDFKPIWWYVARMQMHILTPEQPPDVSGTRLPIVYSGGFRGPGSIDVYADDRGGATLRGRFHGVTQQVRMLFASATTGGWAHLRTESGRLPIPFTRGTGYLGLVRRLEASADPAAR